MYFLWATVSCGRCFVLGPLFICLFGCLIVVAVVNNIARSIVCGLLQAVISLLLNAGLKFVEHNNNDSACKDRIDA